MQIADRVAEVSVAHSRQSSEGFRYKILPRSSKLLGITHEFMALDVFLGGFQTVAAQNHESTGETFAD